MCVGCFDWCVCVFCSLHLHGGLLKFSKNEDSAEILRRRLVLLLYLLRSPFYDTFTKYVSIYSIKVHFIAFVISFRDSLLSVLQGLSQYVPLIRFIIGKAIFLANLLV